MTVSSIASTATRVLSWSAMFMLPFLDLLPARSVDTSPERQRRDPVIPALALGACRVPALALGACVVGHKPGAPATGRPRAGAWGLCQTRPRRVSFAPLVNPLPIPLPASASD